MTQEEKQILLQDLSARLPYGVKASTKIGPIIIVSGIYEDTIKDETEDSYDVSFIKPYLRPMSSMTDEEIKEYVKIRQEEYDNICESLKNGGSDDFTFFQTKRLDFLISHHFDYRGLIPMGLALEAPEGMYKEK